MADPIFAQLDELAPVPCPCGSARRAFAAAGNAASVHLVQICAAARAHRHIHTTEIYVVLEGNGEVEVDGKRFAVRPLSAIYIAAGCRHRAIGNLKVINIPVPAFDPADERLD